MQYWLDVKEGKGQLIAVTLEAVYAESGALNQLDAQAQRLKAGESPAQVFGKDATHVVLRSATKLSWSTADDELTFTIGSGKESKTESLSIDDVGIREQVYLAVQRVTDGRFQHFEDQYSKARAAFASALTLSIFALGTGIAVKAAIAIRAVDEYVVEGRRKGMKQLVVWVLDTLGPWGVGVMGALLCALALLVLSSRLREPPFVRILQAERYAPQASWVTGLKYAMLAGLWFVMAPAAFL